jgi:hypothetical protein
MSDQQFELHFRAEDIRHLYQERLTYKVFVPANNTKLAFIALFFVMAVLGYLGSSYFSFLLYLCAFGYMCIEVSKSYLEHKRTTKDLNEWIESLRGYKTHRLILGDKFFRYHRDNEVYTYEMDKVKTYRATKDYFFFQSLDDTRIVLPAKSFAPGEFDAFVKAVAVMV